MTDAPAKRVVLSKHPFQPSDLDHKFCAHCGRRSDVHPKESE